MKQGAMGLRFEFVPAVHTLVSYTGDHPRQEQWESYITTLEGLTHSAVLRFVVFIESDPLPNEPRQRIAAIVRNKPWPTALISKSVALRFVVSTFSLVNKHIRFFTPEQLADAWLHLGLDAEEAALVAATLERLRRGG